jgi:penicillin-binding protein 1A
VMEGKGQFVLTARTTVDLGLQQSADNALQSMIRLEGRNARMKSGAIVAMEPDGAVRALVGGLDYGESQFNRATHARRQPGSSFKLYVYATALENGYTNRSVVSDNPVSCGNWSPKNYSGGSGSGRSIAIGDAFKTSLNTTAVDLSLKAGRDKVVEMTQRLGVEGVKKTCSMALGDTGITPIQHTGAYATFANGGKLAKPYAILEVFNSKGDLVYSRERDEPPAPQVIRPRVAEQMNQLMQLVVTEGTGKKAALDFTHSVGKTGTSSSYRDAWFMGFTGALVTGVWLGNDDYTRMNNVTGGSWPAVTWANFMNVAHPSKDIATIPGLQPHPAQVAEKQRLAEARRLEPAPTTAQAEGAPRRSASIMPEPTREALKKLATAMRKAGGVAPEPSAAPGSAAPAAAADRRAEAGGLAGGLGVRPRGQP